MNGFGNQIITIDTSTIEMYPPWTYPLQICYTYVYIYIYIYLSTIKILQFSTIGISSGSLAIGILHIKTSAKLTEQHPIALRTCVDVMTSWRKWWRSLRVGVRLWFIGYQWINGSITNGYVIFWRYTYPPTPADARGSA